MLLRDRTKDQINIGNATLDATLKIVATCSREQVAMILENPATSMAWQADGMRSVACSPAAHFVIVDQCQFGAKFRKITGLLLLNGVFARPVEKTCTGKTRMVLAVGPEACEPRRRGEYPAVAGVPERLR